MNLFFRLLIAMSFLASSIATAQPIQDPQMSESLACIDDILARDHRITQLIDAKLNAFEKKYGPINQFSRKWKLKLKQQKRKP